MEVAVVPRSPPAADVIDMLRTGVLLAAGAPCQRGLLGGASCSSSAAARLPEIGQKDSAFG